MQDNKKNNNSTNSNNSKNNLIGLAIFVVMFILIIIVIAIFTKSILPSSGNTASSMMVADSNLGIHTDTTTKPVTVKSKNDSSQNDNNDNEYDNDYDSESDDSNNMQGTVMTVKSSVNVRSGPGSSYKQIGELATGREVTVYENINGWYRISFNGSTDAYVYSGYISGSLPESTSSNAYNAYAESTTTYTSYAQYNQNNNFNNDSNDGGYYYN